MRENLSERDVVFERACKFCRCWFEEKNPESTVEFFCEDVCFVGTGVWESAQGRTEMEAYVRQDIAAMREAFSSKLETVYENMLATGFYRLSARLTLVNSLYKWNLRILFLMRKEKDGLWRICDLNVSEDSRNQRGDEHYPDSLVIERITEARQELLNDSIAGGMMGGYIEEGFPFYFVDRRMLDYLGYRDEAEFVADIGGMISNCMHPDDRAAVDESVTVQLTKGNEYVVEYRMKKRDGSYIWVHDMGRRIRSEDGRDVIISVCGDISDTKKLRDHVRELYEQEISYFSALSTVEGKIRGRMNVTRNRVEVYTAPDDVAVTKTGDSYENFVNGLADSAAEPQPREQIRRELSVGNLCENFMSGKIDYRFSFLRRRNDGRLFWCRTDIRVGRNPDTDDVMLFFYTADETERYLQQKLLNHLVAQDYDNIIDLDLKSEKYRFISQKDAPQDVSSDGEGFKAAVRKMAEGAMQEKSRAEYREKLDFAYMRKRLAEEDSYSFTAEIRTEEGEICFKRYQIFYISRELDRVCITRSDVTDIVRKEQRQKEELSVALLAAEQANAAKSNFLSRMSHEIRTPMNAIIGMTAIAAQAIGNDDTVSDCLSKIGISSRFLLSLINDILDMSRIESGKMLLKNEDIPMEEFVNGINAICHGQAENKGVDYECVVDPMLDDYYTGDAMKLQQVLVNILSNAVKFTGAGGKVTFSVMQKKKKKDSAFLRFTVNDTGIGISEEFLPHIFESFTQESSGTTALYGGTGLGLTISKNIVDLMGGKITVRSIKDIGTEFTVDVPLGVSEREKKYHGKQNETLDFSDLRTLVVDDDVTVCESAALTLKEMGIVAEWVDSGQKAVERVGALWESGGYYDVILIDWKMPEMDGIETTRHIRAIVGEEVTIIIMTAYDWGSIEHEAKLAGANLLMSKPMFKSSMISAFSKAFGEKEEEKIEEKPKEFDFNGKRVLLAEDNAINTEVAVRLLTGKGFAVETAENGLRALEMFSKSSFGYYDAVLMDIRMPLMDGLTAASGIRHLSNPDALTVPIIAMTANAFDDDVDKSKAAGMNAHLAKPIDPQRLYQTLYEFIFLREEGRL